MIKYYWLAKQIDDGIINYISNPRKTPYPITEDPYLARWFYSEKECRQFIQANDNFLNKFFPIEYCFKLESE